MFNNDAKSNKHLDTKNIFIRNNWYRNFNRDIRPILYKYICADEILIIKSFYIYEFIEGKLHKKFDNPNQTVQFISNLIKYYTLKIEHDYNPQWEDKIQPHILIKNIIDKENISIKNLSFDEDNRDQTLSIISNTDIRPHPYRIDILFENKQYIVNMYVLLLQDEFSCNYNL